MLKEFDSILKKMATAKGLLILLLVALFGIFVWKNFNFLTEVTFSIKNPGATNPSQVANASAVSKHSTFPQLAIGKVILPPAPKELPTIIVFEIDNPGTGVTNNIRISLDLGSAKAIGYEVLGANKLESQQNSLGTSIIGTVIDKIGPGEHAYFYVHCSQPTFTKISLSSPDVFGSVEYDYKKYRSSYESDHPDKFKTFLYVLFGIFIMVMGIYFTAMLIQFFPLAN